MNNKIKLSVGLVLGAITLLGLFAVPTTASAMTCNSATLAGNVITGTPPARARFTYSTNYNTVLNGGGTPTTVQTFYADGYIEQYISGLTENTTYYFRLEVTNNYGTANFNILNFTTPQCTQPIQIPTVSLVANPTSVQAGGNSTLFWNSQNASSCSAYWTNSNATYGSGIVAPNVTTTYNITCTSSTGQQASASATVYVNQTQQIFQQICQDPSALNYRGVLPCTYNNYVVQVCQDPSALNYRGVLPCTYAPYVAPYIASYLAPYVTPYVNNQPTVTVYSNQTNVAYNGSATIRWITTNATFCYASSGSVGWAGAKSIGPGSFYTGLLTASKTYTLTCSNNFGSASDSETITVRAQAVTTVASPKPVPTSLVLITSSVDRNQPIVPTIDNTRPRPGDEINYTVSYQNIGTGAITNLSLRIDLPYEVDYISSTPNNPIRSGNTLIFNLGTLKANGQGVVTIKTRVRDNIPAGTNLNFPATLSYTDPSNQPQSVSANVSAQVWSEPANENVFLGANVFGASFLPNNLFGWLFLAIMILILVSLARYLFGQSFRQGTVTVVDQPSGKKTTTTTT